jgi:hypothetical protein
LSQYAQVSALIWLGFHYGGYVRFDPERKNHIRRRVRLLSKILSIRVGKTQLTLAYALS